MENKGSRFPGGNALTIMLGKLHILSFKPVAESGSTFACLPPSIGSIGCLELFPHLLPIDNSDS